jgi:hypothetical protein
MDAAVYFPYVRTVTGASGTRERERELQRGHRGQSSRPAARPEKVEKVIDLAPQDGVWTEKGTLLAVTSNARSLHAGRSVVYNCKGHTSAEVADRGLYINTVA